MIKKFFRGIGYGIGISAAVAAFAGIVYWLMGIAEQFFAWVDNLPVDQQSAVGLTIIFGFFIIAGILLSFTKKD